MRSRVNKFITTNPWLKLASLILAIAMWFFVVSKGRSIIIMDVPIGFKNIPGNLEVVDVPKVITISIEGQERLLKNLREEDVNVVIDLSNVKEGKAFFPLTSDNIALPKTFTVTRISPQGVKLLIEEKIKKRVPVRPIIIGSPAEGFLIKGIEVVPKKIEIEGPKSIIIKVHSVKTEAIDITGIIENLQYIAPLNLNNNNKENVRVDIPEVEVNISVQRTK
jgi:YbbR domain-containing protein